MSRSALLSVNPPVIPSANLLLTTGSFHHADIDLTAMASQIPEEPLIQSRHEPPLPTACELDPATVQAPVADHARLTGEPDDQTLIDIDHVEHAMFVLFGPKVIGNLKPW